jgi:hypothetical protein
MQSPVPALCILCRSPTFQWCDFIHSFTTYALYVVVDEESFPLDPFREKYPGITFVSIPSDTCRQYFFLDMNFIMSKKVTSWEKAMYYFSVENTGHHHVWFLEDDVFFCSEDTLRKLDAAYPDAHLLSAPVEENRMGKKDYWHWSRIHIQLPPPYYFGMMCAVRLSLTLLSCIREYASRHKTLFFLEALFPTVAMHYRLLCQQPPEMHTIHYRWGFTQDQIVANPYALFHPVKNEADRNAFHATRFAAYHDAHPTRCPPGPTAQDG